MTICRRHEMDVRECCHREAEGVDSVDIQSALKYLQRWTWCVCPECGGDVPFTKVICDSCK